MKKILFILMCMFVFTYNIKAECTDSEILKWAKEAKISYETSENVTDPEYLYYLFIEPSRDDIEIVATRDKYSGEIKGAMQENGKYGIASYVHFEEITYTISVYMKKDAKACAGEQILKLRKTIPQYNSYSKTAYCEQYPEAELCAVMSDANDLTQEEFIEQMEEYIESTTIKDNPNKDKNLILVIIFDYLIWLIVPAIVIGIIYKFKIKKVRREKDEK